MKNRFDFKTVLLFSAVIMGTVGCGAHKAAVPERPPDAVEEIDPFAFGDEFAFRTKGIKTTESVNSGGVTTPARERNPVSVPTPNQRGSADSDSGVPSAVGTPQPQDGVVYRVQVGIFEERPSAMRRVEEARAKTDQPVYLEFESPFYRVRVGNFLTKKEAEEYVKILRDEGFHGSFWVMRNVSTP